VIPIGAILVGIVLLGGAGLVLRSFGPGYRIGRLLAAARPVSIEEAVAWVKRCPNPMPVPSEIEIRPIAP